MINKLHMAFIYKMLKDASDCFVEKNTKLHITKGETFSFFPFEKYEKAVN